MTDPDIDEEPIAGVGRAAEMVAAAEKESKSWVIDVRPLRLVAYRRMWLGNGISFFGFQFTAVAVPVEMFAITGSSAWVGLLGVAGLVPLMIFGLWGGAVADVVDFGVYSTGAGITVAYAVDAVLFTITFWATWRLPPIPPVGQGADAPKPSAGVRSIVDGLRFLVTRPVLLLSFGVDLIAMVFAMPRALFPEVAEDRFGGGAAVGALFAAIAIGSVIGGLTSGWIGRVKRQGVALVIAVVAWGVAVGFSGFAHQLWLMVLLLAVGGAADLVSAVYRQSILQTFAPDRLRGRLQGVFTVVVAGGPRLGDLRAGATADVTGATASWAGGGFVAAGLALALAATFPALVRYRPPTDPEALR